ncbi:MAG: TonB-dependent receptor [Saprospiraceae bacterium]|nr:TonB-dependent receptor [Saprospiraceae bacterium]
MRQTILALIFLASTWQSMSSQTIKGTIFDKQSEQPLIGANIVLVSAKKEKGTVSDLDGNFTITGVQPGRHILQISYLGFNSTTLPNILVTAGKEVFLEIGLEESTVDMTEVVVKGEVDKDKSNNELATVSARMFTLEEVTRYSGGRNDASRMAANFAGVNIANDSRNDIVIRGNSPTGVLWRLEGIPIPNPNHFATLGTTGGPVSALNTNLLKNSDFLTGAFPAEYGNANAGVFDIQFRSGNRDKFEFTAQLAAFSGLEFMAEGPLNKKNKGSFLVSYRHSFVELAHTAGLRIGTAATPNYKDLSFKIDLGRTKSGSWTIFGIGGLSDIDFLAEEVQDDDFFANQDENSFATSTLAIGGVSHRYLLNDKTYIKTVLAYSTAQNTFDVEDVFRDRDPESIFKIDDQNNRISLSSYINRKFNANWSLRAGILAEMYLLDANSREKEDGRWISRRSFDDQLGLYQLYGQMQWKPSERFTINGGLHSQFLDFNKNLVVEPRAAVNFHLNPRTTLNLGFGLHHQMLPLPVYLFESLNVDGSYVLSNKEVEFTKSYHYVLGIDRKLGTDWRLKSEIYYQNLTGVAVQSDPSSFSILNVGEDFGFPTIGFLVNAGSGRNYGLEMTVEKFFSQGYYTLVTGSLFQSKYKGSDQIERNSAFNNNYVANVLAGKELLFGKNKRNAITLDLKWTVAGGRYYTPIDVALSIQQNREVRVDELAYTDRYDPYFRLDFKIGYRVNNTKKKLSQQFYLDFQNITNHQNVFIQRFNTSTRKINTIYQIGFFPDILYRLQF